MANFPDNRSNKNENSIVSNTQDWGDAAMILVFFTGAAVQQEWLLRRGWGSGDANLPALFQVPVEVVGVVVVVVAEIAVPTVKHQCLEYML